MASQNLRDVESQNYGTYPNAQELPPRSKKRGSKCVRWLIGLCIFLPMVYLFVFYIPTSKPKFVPVEDLQVLKQLNFSPAYSNGSQVIVIGDVHGLYDQMDDLLQKANYVANRDKVVFLGDFISKGPDSLKVIDFAIDNNIECVRGNHEDELLYLYTDHYSLPSPRVEGGKTTRNYEDFDDVEDEVDKEIVLTLKPRHVDYLSSCSAIIDMGKIAPEGYRAVACHGGLMWNVDTLKDQDADTVMTVRTLHGKNKDIPTESKSGTPWTKPFSKVMEKRDPEDRWVVYYGHDASTGLNIKEYTRGHDSGCYKGKRLTATVITQDKHGKFINDLVSVSCDRKTNF